YAAAFAEAGLGQEGDDVEAGGARLQASAGRGALGAAPGDWAFCAAGKGRPAWVLRLGPRGEPRPGGRGGRARGTGGGGGGGGAALADLARTAPVAEQPVSLLVAVGQRLQAAGGDAPTFLRRVQRAHPADFWANLALGNALKYGGSGEAIGYYRVALAIRPGEAVGDYNLAEVLRFQNWLDEAIDYYRRALQAEPGHVLGHPHPGPPSAGTRPRQP